jgi:putative transcriptional regulator
MNCGQMGITTANLSILKTGKAKAIRFSTLEAICEILECQPGDILQYVRKTNKEHIPYFLKQSLASCRAFYLIILVN